jgi:hypothetical protein
MKARAISHIAIGVRNMERSFGQSWVMYCLKGRGRLSLYNGRFSLTWSVT